MIQGCSSILDVEQKGWRHSRYEVFGSTVLTSKPEFVIVSVICIKALLNGDSLFRPVFPRFKAFSYFFGKQEHWEGLNQELHMFI